MRTKELKVLRQGLLIVNGEIVPPAELDKSDWLEKLLQKQVNNIPSSHS
jgi:hypothetical protein